MKPLRLYFDILIIVARADEEIHDAERAFIEALLANYEVSPELRQTILADLVDPAFDVAARTAAIAAHVDAGILAEALRDAYLMALTDGDLAPVEISSLDSILSECGVSASRRPAAHTWARKAAEDHVAGVLLLHDVLQPDSGS